MNIPRTTILIANHNYKQYLADAISSAMKQTYPLVQVCIIDDGSTDGSWELINQIAFAQNEHKTSYAAEGIVIKQAIFGQRKIMAIKLPESKGPSYARNVGIELTLNETDFYLILDADDIALPKKMEKFVEKFIEYDDVAVVYADYDILNVHTGNIIREYKYPYNRRHLNHECIVHSNAGIRASALKEVKDPFGYYDVNMRTCEDYDLWIRLSEKYTISHIPEVLSLVRNHNNNSTLSVSNDIWNKNWSRIQEKIQMRSNV